ncbi:hypothetical protein ACEZCY_19025 [Streptacidiphilus sp. N1-12]|uniref:Uncharacterized protein n=2 Tax=Streptacidiphilus alkalitolerans TaxID=3342712 RepID=A0ABV6VBH2_9ACTN
MAETTEVLARAGLIPHAGQPYAYLMLEDPRRSVVVEQGGEPTTVFVAAALAAGLYLANTGDSLEVPTAEGWSAELRSGRLSLTSPEHREPFLPSATLQLPHGWRTAARYDDDIVVFVGDDLGLARERSGSAGPLPLGQALARAAERGMLAVGTVAYHEAGY